MPYHHGDLRRALLDAAAEEIAAAGVAALSLRKIATAVGVSHAAATHHFGDKQGLLTALAAEGHRLLLDGLRRAGPDLIDAGVAYVRFAADHSGHFAVMFEPALVRPDDAALADASAATFGALRSIAGSYEAAVARWAFVHGLATLHLAGALRTTSTRQLVSLLRRAAATLGGSGLP